MSNLDYTYIHNCIVTLLDFLLFCFNILFPSLAFNSLIFGEKKTYFFKDCSARLKKSSNFGSSCR